MGNFTSIIKLFKVNLFNQVGTSICQGLFIPYVHKQLLWTFWFKETESSSNFLHIRLLCPILAVCDVKENIPVSFSFWDGESPDIFLGFGDLTFGFVFDSFFGFFFSSSISKGASVSWSNPRAAASRPWLGGATTGWDRAAASSGALATTSDLKKALQRLLSCNSSQSMSNLTTKMTQTSIKIKNKLNKILNGEISYDSTQFLIFNYVKWTDNTTKCSMSYNYWYKWTHDFDARAPKIYLNLNQLYFCQRNQVEHNWHVKYKTGRNCN